MEERKTSRDLMIENNKLLKELNRRPLVVLKEVEQMIAKSMVAYENFIDYQDQIKKREYKLAEIETQINKLRSELTKTRKETCKIRWLALFPTLLVLMIIILLLELWQIAN